MKHPFRNALRTAAKRDFVWYFLNQTLFRLADFGRSLRETEESRFYTRAISSFLTNTLRSGSPEVQVCHGPFKGMIYPVPDSLDRAMIPRIVGSYEKEIQPIIEEICSKSYESIFDVGCAEGYYAVGLALRIPTAKVFAYDLRDSALLACRKMAQANDASDRIVTASFCDSEELRKKLTNEKSLIVSDCEGFETSLFNESVIPFLTNCDILIETHDFVDIEISSQLRKRFERTHLITAIQSCDDITKAHTYSYPELQGYTLAERRVLLSEERPSIMEWLYLTPR